ncbi:LysR family transcriptional regulator [Atopobium fossor]|uniref:LysR family transcriptional regulator n=1 Tax=Atopobium fossor TaxID=39487 RepID=UPI00040E61AA|nr:LysR family transcriptional regulator [Atopobium fossor]
MNFQSMDYFVALAEEQSFTKAAKRLHITQQTLSAHIASLEKELRVKLVNRRVPLSLTASGQEFLSFARRFRNEERDLRHVFDEIAGDKRGLLGVGIASTRGHMIMPDAITRYRNKYPNIRVRIYEGENTELLELLKEGRIDMAVSTISSVQPQLVVRDLYEENIVLVVSNQLLHSLYGDDMQSKVAEVERTGSLKALKDLPYLLLGEKDVPGKIARLEFERAGFRPNVAVYSTNSETLFALAQHGVGAAFCPKEMVKVKMGSSPNPDLRTIELSSHAHFKVSAAWLKTDHVWSVIESFYKTLVEQTNDRRKEPL